MASNKHFDLREIENSGIVIQVTPLFSEQKIECVILKYATIHNHPQSPIEPPTTIHSHPQLPTTIHNYPKPPKKPPTTIHNHPQPLTITHNYPQLSTTTYNHPKKPQNHPQLSITTQKLLKPATNSYVSAFYMLILKQTLVLILI